MGLARLLASPSTKLNLGSEWTLPVHFFEQKKTQPRNKAKRLNGFLCARSLDSIGSSTGGMTVIVDSEIYVLTPGPTEDF
jgi:hypothetical protein